MYMQNDNYIENRKNHENEKVYYNVFRAHFWRGSV